MNLIVRFSIFLLLACTSQLYAQQFDYNGAWKRVHQLEIKELNKSAKEAVLVLRNQAIKDKNEEQNIKCLLYLSKFGVLLEEEGQVKAVAQLKEAIDNAKSPSKEILHSILATSYWKYFEGNRWRYYDRSNREGDWSKEDFRLWDAKTMLKAIDSHYTASLALNGKYNSTPIGAYKAIIEWGDQEANGNQKTVYEFLLYQALEYYSSSELRQHNPENEFYIDGNQYFTPFFKDLPTISDSTSTQYKALVLFKTIQEHYEQNDNFEALVAIEKDRLSFVYQKGKGYFSVEQYIASLEAAEKVYPEVKSNADLAYTRALSLYDNVYRSTKENNYRQKALVICEETAKRYPETYGAVRCNALKDRIKRIEFSVKYEKIIPVNQHARFKLEYRGVKGAHHSLYAISFSDFKQFFTLNELEKVAFLQSKEAKKEWSTQLQEQIDYNDHSTEIVLDPLPAGAYLIVVKAAKEAIKEKDYLEVGAFQVSDMSVVYNANEAENAYYQALNRNTGKPIEKATLIVTKRYQKDSTTNIFRTDKYGRARSKVDKHYSYGMISGIYLGDTTDFGNYYFRNQYGRTTTETVSVKPFLFTDRAIYRPGQEVFFKGILTQNKGKYAEVAPNEAVEVFLSDANGQEVARVQLRSNTYGSFSGTFTLPSTGLTGRYSLEVEEGTEESELFDTKMEDFVYNPLSIQVEEYKRPKFEVVLDKVEKLFAVHDSVTVNGKARAFAGNAIGDASVQYRVVRKVQYPIWYYWEDSPFQDVESSQMTHGTTTTDAQGRFSLVFVAMPDTYADKEAMPVFEYEVTIDVTDINGETRSATQVVKVGYHTTLAEISVSPVWEKSTANPKVEIKLKNLNDQKIEGKGTLSIYKEQVDKKVKRNRLWEPPNAPGIDSITFVRLFPNDFYNSTTKATKKTLVWSGQYDSKTMAFVQPNIKNWETGNYWVEFSAKDAKGSPIKAVEKVAITDKNSTTVSDNSIFSISTDKPHYLPGTEARLVLSSALPELYVTLEYEKKGSIYKREFIRLQNEKTTIVIPITENEIPGFAVHYHYAALNRFGSGTQTFWVQKPSKELSIVSSTFRNKLQPGQKETWAFTLKGEGEQTVVGEVLASMYDASLDQFAPHQWRYNFSPKRRYYAYNSIEPGNGYSSAYGQELNKKFYLSLPDLQNSTLNWFGFSLKGNLYVQRQYLHNVQWEDLHPSIYSSRSKKIKKGWVKGTITDQEGTPLAGVVVKATSNGHNTKSNTSGQYKLRLEIGDEIEYQLPGFTTITVTRQQENQLDVTMVLDSLAVSTRLLYATFANKKNIRTPRFRHGGNDYRKEKSIAGMSLAVTEDEEISEVVLLAKDPSIVEESEFDGVGYIIGLSSLDASKKPLYVVDGKVVVDFTLEANKIASIKVLKGAAAIAQYGAKGANGVVLVETKKAQEELMRLLESTKVRTNFSETAFFKPHIQTNKDGSFTFSFEAPESLTQWKLQLLAHTPSLFNGYLQKKAITQKDLMVVPNVPRFLREGDSIQITAKITNLTSKEQNGHIALLLTNPETGAELDTSFLNAKNKHTITVPANGNTVAEWNIVVPEGVDGVQYKIVAVAGDFSDGEQSYLPILKNGTFVTEALPMFIVEEGRKQYEFESLKNNSSSTLQHQNITLEFTGNPVWNVVKSMPYLLEFPHECAEQTFARYYSNVLVGHIQSRYPKVQSQLKQWAEVGALKSALEKNEKLKSLLIQETPWVRSAQSETEKQQLLVALFAKERVAQQLSSSREKLKNMQLPNGGFPWFRGSDHANRYITLHIASTFHQLQKTNAVVKEDAIMQAIIEKSLKYLDQQFLEDYKNKLKTVEQINKDTNDKAEAKQRVATYWNGSHLSDLIVDHLTLIQAYERDVKDSLWGPAITFFESEARTKWVDLSLSSRAKLAQYFAAKGKSESAQAIMRSLYENSTTSTELGMYWKENQWGYGWYAAPVETQAHLLEAFVAVNITSLTDKEQQKCIDNMVLWLLRQKQSNQWRTTKATTLAIRALLAQDFKVSDAPIEIQLGKEKITLNEETSSEKGINYIQKTWDKTLVNAKMGTISIKKKGDGVAWGAVYWQYFEKLDKLKASTSFLQVNKSIFRVETTQKGEVLKEITEENPIKIGDKIRVRLEISTDRNMDFIHLKDHRASGLEPIDVVSSYQWKDGLGYYQSTKDASTHFFFDSIQKGKYVLEYDLRANNAGSFSNGNANIESMYAPEFRSQSKGIKVKIQ